MLRFMHAAKLRPIVDSVYPFDASATRSCARSIPTCSATSWSRSTPPDATMLTLVDPLDHARRVHASGRRDRRRDAPRLRRLHERCRRLAAGWRARRSHPATGSRSWRRTGTGYSRRSWASRPRNLIVVPLNTRHAEPELARSRATAVRASCSPIVSRRGSRAAVERVIGSPTSTRRCSPASSGRVARVRRSRVAGRALLHRRHHRASKGVMLTPRQPHRQRVPQGRWRAR